MNAKLQVAIDLGRREHTSMWCAVEKHHACKGRRFDANYHAHQCGCPCHAGR